MKVMLKDIATLLLGRNMLEHPLVIQTILSAIYLFKKLSSLKFIIIIFLFNVLPKEF